MRPSPRVGTTGLISIRRCLRATTLAVAVAMVSGAGPGEVGAQAEFVDDAGRHVHVPSRVNRVFAAGAPAEVLLYTLVPEKLPGRNRLPDPDSLTFFPEVFQAPRLIRSLPNARNADGDADLLAIAPDLYVDYGWVHPDYVAAVEAVTRRTAIPGIILDGRLDRIPEIYRRLGALLGVEPRGRELADAAAALLARYRGVLGKSGAPVRVYLTCSPDGLEPCLADEPASEQLAHLGAINVAGTSDTARPFPLSVGDIAALSPDVVVVTGFSGAAGRLRSNPDWQKVPAVAMGRVYQLPGQPFSWGARPPSVNRLIGLAWLAYALQGRPTDEALRIEVTQFFRRFYHLDLTDDQLALLLRR